MSNHNGVKLPEDVWKAVYDEYVSSPISLSAIYHKSAAVRECHSSPTAFRKAFDNFLGRAKLPGRLGRGE